MREEGQPKKTVSIAIDGPAGAGKSTISKALARSLGFVYIDTGAMYRCVALYALEHGIDTHNSDGALARALSDISIDLTQTHVYLNGRDVTDAIRAPKVSIGASDVAVVREVRLFLVEQQRALARARSVVMDGRDIGTYVLPDADIKIFLTATVQDRARRRHEELVEKNGDAAPGYEQILKDMEYRDKNDASRAFAPLRQADDAVRMDTTSNTLAQSIDMITNYVKERL